MTIGCLEYFCLERLSRRALAANQRYANAARGRDLNVKYHCVYFAPLKPMMLHGFTGANGRKIQRSTITDSLLRLRLLRKCFLRRQTKHFASQKIGRAALKALRVADIHTANRKRAALETTAKPNHGESALRWARPAVAFTNRSDQFAVTSFSGSRQNKKQYFYCCRFASLLSLAFRFVFTSFSRAPSASIMSDRVRAHFQR